MRFLTAGESHGPIQWAIIEGFPAGVPLPAEVIDAQLARRQLGYGRGGRQRIETDRVQFKGGVRNGLTTGGPIALEVPNKDFASWELAMGAGPVDPTDEARMAATAAKRIDRLRPGHADYPGVVKYGLEDVRDVLERASARETTARVAAGSVARQLLVLLGLDLTSHVVALGGIHADLSLPIYSQGVDQLRAAAEPSPVRCADPAASAQIVAKIDEFRKAGDTLGGITEVRTSRLPVGMGSHVHWDRRLDGRLAQALMGIHAIKGVEVGLGFQTAHLPGSQVHDPFLPGFQRPSNHAGGLEGGMTNGMPLIVRMAMKPIPTLREPLPSVRYPTGEAVEAHFERSDVTAVPASGVIAEAMVAWVLCEALLEKLGGDHFQEINERYQQLADPSN